MQSLSLAQTSKMNTQHEKVIFSTGSNKKQKLEHETVDHISNLKNISKKSKTIGCNCGPCHKQVNVEDYKNRKHIAKHIKVGHEEANVRNIYEDDQQTRTILAKLLVNKSNGRQGAGEAEQLLKEW